MLKEIAGAEGLWEARALLEMPLGTRLPLRMTVARLPDSTLWVHSPILIDDALAQQLTEIGTVRHLVAPSATHCLFLNRAMKRFPEAQVHLPPGLEPKLKGRLSGLPFGAAPPSAWGGAFDMQAIEGAPRMAETVFLHRSSGTLICSDLVFNVRRWNSRLLGWILWVAGTRGRFAMSRGWRLFVRDRAAFWASLEPVRQWAFHRVLMGHGEVFEHPDARDVFFAALEQRIGNMPNPGNRA